MAIRIYLIAAHSVVMWRNYSRALDCLSLALGEANRISNRKVAGRILVAMAACRRAIQRDLDKACEVYAAHISNRCAS